MQPSSSRDIISSSSGRASGLPSHPDRAAIVLSVVVGALLGIGLGFFSMAGWFAVALGAVLGAVGGGLIAKVTVARGHRQSAKDRVLDREIGVIP